MIVFLAGAMEVFCFVSLLSIMAFIVIGMIFCGIAELIDRIPYILEEIKYRRKMRK